jgi:hypothetical protein
MYIGVLWGGLDICAGNLECVEAHFLILGDLRGGPYQ